MSRVLVVLLLLGSCAPVRVLTLQEQMWVTCTAWERTYTTATLRRQMNLSTEEEIVAINRARSVLNPLCLSEDAEPNEGLLALAERALIQLAVQEREER